MPAANCDDYEVRATPTWKSLRGTTEKSATTLRGLMHALVAETGRWPGG